ncbi:MAG: hypothetical protein EXR99_01795 [Gemmataceae bacterium]|nr:hypothetical protein [Gemmataceae bacterium]
MIRKLFTVAGTLCLLAGFSALGFTFQEQPKVNLRANFRIQVFGVERLKQVNEMLIFLKNAGFTPASSEVFDELQDEKIAFLDGTISKGKEPGCLNPRWIHSVISWPEGIEPPFKEEKQVRLELVFPQPFPISKQREFYQLMQLEMKANGFQDGLGYSHQGFSRLTGNLPGISLNLIDNQSVPRALGSLPGGRKELGRVLRVLGEDFMVKPRPMPLVAMEELAKFPPTSREWLGKNGEGNNQVLWNLVLNPHPPSEQVVDQFKDAIPGVELEGHSGALLQIRSNAQGIQTLARHPAVLFVSQAENPPPSKTQFLPGDFQPLFTPGSTDLSFKFNFLQGVAPIAVLGADFTGWKTALPKDKYPVRFVDYLQPRSKDFLGTPFDETSANPSRDSLLAKGVADGCPGREIILVRVEPTASSMLDEIGEMARTGRFEFPSFIRGMEGSREGGKALDHSYQLLLEERKKLFEEFSDNEESEKRRKDFKVKMDSWQKDYRQLHEKIQRMLQFRETLLALKKARTFLLCFNPPEILPHRLDSPLGLFSDIANFKTTLWFIPPKPASRPGYWKGPVLDADSNSVLEFQPGGAQTAWENERLQIVLREGAKKELVPDQKRIRVRLRWREPVDSLVFAASGGKVTTPQASFNLVLLKKGDKLPFSRDDEFAPIGETGTVPFCIYHSKTLAVFEHWLDLQLPGEGKYYLSILGQDKGGEFHGSLLRQRQTEIYPEVFLDNQDLALQGLGSK